jgi:hypothetical protein
MVSYPRKPKLKSWRSSLLNILKVYICVLTSSQIQCIRPKQTTGKIIRNIQKYESGPEVPKCLRMNQSWSLQMKNWYGLWRELQLSDRLCWFWGPPLATCFMLVSCFTSSSILEMKGIRTSRTIVNLYQTTRRCIRLYILDIIIKQSLPIYRIHCLSLVPKMISLQTLTEYDPDDSTVITTL